MLRDSSLEREFASETITGIGESDSLHISIWRILGETSASNQVASAYYLYIIFDCRTRARIERLHESLLEEAVRVDVLLEDTLETLCRLDISVLVALPDSLKHLKNAELYFSDGFEPYSKIFG